MTAAEEKAERDGRMRLGVWGAAVLRPYMIAVGGPLGVMAWEKRRQDAGATNG